MPVSSILALSTALTSGQTWTSTVEDLKDFGSVGLNVKCDQNATLQFLFSADGSNFDHVVSHSVTSGTALYVSEECRARFLKLSLENTGGSDMTYCRLQCLLHNLSTQVSLDNTTLTVSATDLDVRDLDSAQDSVSAVQSGSWAVNSTIQNASIAVTATDLDVRDLSSASDSVAAVQSGTWAVNSTIQNASLAVTSTDLDIRALASGTDAVDAVQSGNWTVRLNDSAGNAIGSSNGAVLASVDNFADQEANTTYVNLDLGAADDVNVDGNPVVLKHIYCSNNGTGDRYLKIYDKATAPSEADSPALVLLIEANSHISLPMNLNLGNGLGCRATKGRANADDTEPDANDILVNLMYKA